MFLIITHCDKEEATDEFITNKLAAFKKYGPLEIPPENVVRFNKTAESLRTMVERMDNSSMRFVPDLEKKAIEVT